MDIFGIGNAIRGCLTIYFQGARRSGRTTHMIDSLHDGDRVVFSNSVEADRVRRLCKERGVDVDIVTVDPRRPYDLFERPTSRRRTVFDHIWVEQYYQAAFDRAEADLKHITTQCSGYGEAHRETRRRAGGPVPPSTFYRV